MNINKWLSKNIYLKSEMYCYESVSYTHLDVYKRQDGIDTTAILKNGTYFLDNPCRFHTCRYKEHLQVINSGNIQTIWFEHRFKPFATLWREKHSKQWLRDCFISDLEKAENILKGYFAQELLEGMTDKCENITNIVEVIKRNELSLIHI